MPEGNENGKGKFEFALGHIGWAVASGFAAGSVRGFVPELVNPETRQLVSYVAARCTSRRHTLVVVLQRGRPWVTRLMNATVKHGSGYAQPAGAAMFMFSVFEIVLRRLRADDDLNSLAAGAFAGALYRSPHGMRAVAKGSGVGLLLAAAWIAANSDSRQRVREMFNFA